MPSDVGSLPPVFRVRVPGHILVTRAALLAHADDYRSAAAILAACPERYLAHPEERAARVAEKLELVTYFERLATAAWR